MRPFDQTTAVILAGGLGTRIRHLLPDLPKPMAPVAGRPFLDWVIRYLVRQGVSDVVISTGYLAHVVSDYFRRNPIRGATVQCVAEPEPLGTAGGFLQAARSSGRHPDAWLVLNGDSLVFADLEQLRGAVESPDLLGGLLGLPVEDASRYGSLSLDGEGILRGFAEKQPGRGIISAGVYLLRAPAVSALPAGKVLSFERDVFPGWVQAGEKIRVVPTTAPFLDIGTEESLARASEFIGAHQAQIAG